MWVIWREGGNFAGEDTVSVLVSGLAALERLGLAAADSRQLLSELHVSAVLALGDIIAARRQLDSIIARRGVG